MYNKEVLAEFIYRQNKDTWQFLKEKTLFSSPEVGFLYNNSLRSGFLNSLDRCSSDDSFWLCRTGDIICYLADWGDNIAEGIIFTDTTMYVHSPKNKDKNFDIDYNQIAKLKRDHDGKRIVIEPTWSSANYIIDTKLWRKSSIHDFLQFASGKNRFSNERILDIHLETMQGRTVRELIS